MNNVSGQAILLAPRNLMRPPEDTYIHCAKTTPHSLSGLGNRPACLTYSTEIYVLEPHEQLVWLHGVTASFSAKKVNFADEILEKLIAKTEGESQPAQEIHNFVKDLRNILNLAERAASDVSAGEEHGDMTQILRELQKESKWQQFYDFMGRCATQTPPSPYIFRSEMHGYPFPRFEDEYTGEIVSSFASDAHAWVESDCQSEIFVSMSSPRDMHDTDSDLVDEVAMHLKKTQINKRRAARNEE